MRWRHSVPSSMPRAYLKAQRESQAAAERASEESYRPAADR